MLFLLAFFFNVVERTCSKHLIPSNEVFVAVFLYLQQALNAMGWVARFQ